MYYKTVIMIREKTATDLGTNQVMIKGSVLGHQCLDSLSIQNPICKTQHVQKGQSLQKPFHLLGQNQPISPGLPVRG